MLSRTWFKVWILHFSMLCNILVPASASEGSEMLFIDEGISRSLSGIPNDARAKRLRLVYLNNSWFSSLLSDPRYNKSSEITLNLFDDVAHIAVLQTVQAKGQNEILCTGYLKGIPESSVILAFENGVVTGYIFFPGRGMFSISYFSDGLHKVLEIDPRKALKCGGAIGFPISQLPGVSDPINSSKESAIKYDVYVGNQSLVTVDVLVVYTSIAREAMGGASAINTMIEASVAQANVIYENSGIDLQLNLVYRGEIVYAESQSSHTDLERLAGNQETGEFLDEVHSLRDTHGADLVSLIVEEIENGGRAYCLSIPANASQHAFSVVRRDQSLEFMAFAHEIGHNLGCAHNPEDIDCNGAYSYARGHKFTGADDEVFYRTVMAYPPGQQVLYHSNPSISYQGTPTGITNHDNARTINNTRTSVVDFRDSNSPPPVIESLTYYPDPVMQNFPFFLQAENVVDTDGVVTKVEFYRNTNGNTQLDIGIDELLGIDTVSTPSWFKFFSANFPAGLQRYFARAQDDSGRWSVAVTTTGTVVSSSIETGGYVDFTATSWKDFSGDDDGNIEGAEQVSLRISLSSSVDIQNVEATLRSNLGNLNITDNIVQFPPIQAGDEEWSSSRFYMFLDLQSFDDVPLNLHVTYKKDNQLFYQDFQFSKTFHEDGIFSAAFDVLDFIIDDSPSIQSSNNGDGLIQSGESVRIKPRIKNIGISNATNVEVSIGYDGPELVIPTSTENYPDLSPEDIGYPSPDVYYKVVDIQRDFAGTVSIDVHVRWDENLNGETLTNGLVLDIAPTGWMSVKWVRNGSSDLDFGVVPPGNDVSEILTIENQGSGNLNVTIDETYDDTSIISTGFPLEIPPSQNRDATVNIETSGLNQSIIRELLISSDGRASSSNGEGSSQNVRLSGTITEISELDISELFHLNANGLVSLAAGDTDNDGNSEIVVLSSVTPKVRIFERDVFNNFIERWNSGTTFQGTDIRNNNRLLSVTDINSDGKDDIVFAVTRDANGNGTPGKLYLIESFSDNQWSVTWSGFEDVGSIIDLITGDSDNDGKMEILVVVSKRVTPFDESWIYVLENTGGNSFSEIYSITDLRQGNGDKYKDFGALTVADSDNDGQNEILFTSGSFFWESGAGNSGDQLFIYESTGNDSYTKSYSGLSSDHDNFDRWDFAVLAVGDPDGDGKSEILIADEGSVILWIFEITENDSWNTDLSIDNYEYKFNDLPSDPLSLHLADIALDDRIEILIGINNNAQGATAIILNSIASDSYVETWRSTDLPNEELVSIAITDTDSSGLPRILFGVNGDSVYTYGIQPLLDLSISQSNVSIFDAEPVEGLETKLLFTISNVQQSPVRDITVRVYDGDPDSGGQQIDQDVVIPQLESGEAVVLEVNWTPLGEGIHNVYIVIDPDQVIPEINENNNKTSKLFVIRDSDILGPAITDITVTEYDGDGDGNIGSDEKVRISWSLSDDSDIGTVDLFVDQQTVELSGDYWAILNPLISGEHQVQIIAFDADESPESKQKEFSFEVLQAEVITVIYNGQVIDNGTQDLDVGLFSEGVDSVEVILVIRNDGEQTLNLNQISVSSDFVLTEPSQTSLIPGVIVIFSLKPNTSISKILTGLIEVQNSDTDNNQFTISIIGEVRPDIDGDGIRDVWEYEYFPTLEIADENTDQDRDGKSDREEYIAGTDPINAFSYFEVKEIFQLTDAQSEVRWHSIPGKTYTVQFSEDLQSWQDIQQIIATDIETSYTFQFLDFRERFCRIKILESQ